VLSVCAAYVKNDAMGRFIYFALRYPSTEVIRHKQGASFSEANHVRLTFVTERQTKIDLVFEPATLATERYPSQKERFSRIHEVTGYYADDPKRPIRSVNGQAYEQSFEDASDGIGSYLTLIGRIDASLITATPEDYLVSASSKHIQVGVTLFQTDAATNKSIPTFEVTPGEIGQSAISFEKLYRTNIESKATLEITETLNDPLARSHVIWTSRDLNPTRETTGPGLVQRASDWWASKIVELFALKKSPQETKIEARGRQVIFKLREERLVLPDIATRALFLLSIALFVVLGVSAVWLRVTFNMRKITRAAYSMTVNPTSPHLLLQNKEKGETLGEIETLGRTLDLLMRKARSRNANLTNRMEQTKVDARVAEEHFKSRQSILDAIGHEIRSPLQALISKTAGNPTLHKDIERMRRAVAALDMATSVEAGIRNNTIVVRQDDIAAYISTFATNVSTTVDKILYSGPVTGIEALYDEISMDQILDHLLDNARDHRIEGTPIVITLQANEATVAIAVSNQGAHIPDDMLQNIFNYGVSSEVAEGNFGLGLFVVRVYLLAMGGTIHAQNDENGVSLIATLQKRQIRRL
jgi:signal transduction histidine kinase